MSDEPRDITDDLLLSELTVGEFKQLLKSLIPEMPASTVDTRKIDPPVEKVSIRRKSLDEFMNDLGEK